MSMLSRWSERSAGGLQRVVSPSFGEVLRRGKGSGRSGNHNADAWAVLVGASDGDGPSRVVDLPASVCAAFGAPTEHLSGEPFVR